MNNSKVIDSIKQVAERVLPKGSLLYLYGSRARGDWHDGSDWDLLLILDKPRLEHEDFNKYSYPFVEMIFVPMHILSKSGLMVHMLCSIIM